MDSFEDDSFDSDSFDRGEAPVSGFSTDTSSSLDVVDTSAPPVAPARMVASTAGRRVHVLQRGDTLMSLARHYYGDASAWRAILEANRDQVKDPNLVYVGQTLVIPE